MKLYHGSNTEIDAVDLAQCRPYKTYRSPRMPILPTSIVSYMHRA